MLAYIELDILHKDFIFVMLYHLEPFIPLGNLTFEVSATLMILLYKLKTMLLYWMIFFSQILELSLYILPSFVSLYIFD